MSVHDNNFKYVIVNNVLLNNLLLRTK